MFSWWSRHQSLCCLTLFFPIFSTGLVNQLSFPLSGIWHQLEESNACETYPLYEKQRLWNLPPPWETTPVKLTPSMRNNACETYPLHEKQPLWNLPSPWETTPVKLTLSMRNPHAKDSALHALQHDGRAGLHTHCGKARLIALRIVVVQKYSLLSHPISVWKTITLHLDLVPV